MADAGSKPATSTIRRNGTDHSRPPQASIHAACGRLPSSPHLVPDGPDRSTSWHNSVTSSSHADRLKEYGTADCHRFHKKILSKHESIADILTSGYIAIADERNYVEANCNLLRIDRKLCIHDLNLSWSPDRLHAFAKKKSKECGQIATHFHYNDQAFEKCCDLVEQYQLTPPAPKDYQGDIYPCIKRMVHENWWLRKLQSKQRKLIESTARDMGLVCQQRSTYTSSYSQNQRRIQKERNIHYLESTFIENTEGQRYSLKELHDRSVSNPFVRRAELMTRIKGFEMVAEQLGHIGEFYTITAPSRMHARLKKGIQNPKYDGTSPDEAHQYLSGVFRCIRSKLHRDDLNIYGVRVVEPNHDGTPHWHLLLFMDREIQSQVRQVFQEYALKVDGDEPGAKQHRFKAVAIDPEKGSAAGYVAKYVAKNIDGEHIDEDLHGNDSKLAAKAIDAWASTYNIRQFQYLGGPSVTVWRELRRLGHSKKCSEIAPDTHPLLFEAMQAADAADWAAFVMIMGGVGIKAKDRPIKSLYESNDGIDLDTGEINPEEMTRYGDTKPLRIVGLVCKASQLITRWMKWEIVSSPSKEQRTFSSREDAAMQGRVADKCDCSPIYSSFKKIVRSTCQAALLRSKCPPACDLPSSLGLVSISVRT